MTKNSKPKSFPDGKVARLSTFKRPGRKQGLHSKNDIAPEERPVNDKRDQPLEKDLIRGDGG